MAFEHWQKHLHFEYDCGSACKRPLHSFLHSHSCFLFMHFLFIFVWVCRCLFLSTSSLFHLRNSVSTKFCLYMKAIKCTLGAVCWRQLYFNIPYSFPRSSMMCFNKWCYNDCILQCTKLKYIIQIAIQTHTHTKHWIHYKIYAKWSHSQNRKQFILIKITAAQ